MFIYIIKNKINGKRYVGKTIINVTHRWKKHLMESFNPNLYGYNFLFHKAIRKYGIDNFEFEEIFDYSNSNITEVELGNIEKFYIDKYRTFVRFSDCNGYNLTLGGEGNSGNGVCVDVYDKSLNFINTYNTIEEAGRELNIWSTNIQAVIKGRMKSAGGFIFCENGQEPRPFINDVKTSIDIYDLDRNFIQTCESMTEAAKILNCNITCVFDCCNEKQLTINNHICVYHGNDITKRRKHGRAKEIDVYNLDKQFLKTYKTMISLIEELKIGKSIIQRCLRTDNHLAGDYLIVPHNSIIE